MEWVGLMSVRDSHSSWIYTFCFWEGRSGRNRDVRGMWTGEANVCAPRDVAYATQSFGWISRVHKKNGILSVCTCAWHIEHVDAATSSSVVQRIERHFLLPSFFLHKVTSTRFVGWPRRDMSAHAAFFLCVLKDVSHRGSNT